MKQAFSMLFLFTFVTIILAQTQGNTLKASIERGQKVYANVCLSCHMADGGGVPHMNPPLAGATDIKGDKKKLIRIVLLGMTNIPAKRRRLALPPEPAKFCDKRCNKIYIKMWQTYIQIFI